MIYNFKRWKQDLSHRNQVLVSYLQNILFWFVGPLLADSTIWHRDESLQYYIFHSLFMGLWWTILFSWKSVKDMFKGRRSGETEADRVGSTSE